MIEVAPVWIVVWGIGISFVMIWASLRRPAQIVRHQYPHAIMEYSMPDYIIEEALEKTIPKLKEETLNNPEFLKDLIGRINELQLSAGLPINDKEA